MDSKARHEAAAKGLPYYLEHGNRSTRKQPNWCSRQDCEFMPYRITATGELPEQWQAFGICNHSKSCGYSTKWPNEAAPLPDPTQYRPEPYVRKVQTKFLPRKQHKKSVKQLDHIASIVQMHTRDDLFRKWWSRRSCGAVDPDRIKFLNFVEWSRGEIVSSDAVLFWYVDREWNVHTAKHVQYNFDKDNRFNPKPTANRSKDGGLFYLHKGEGLDYVPCLYRLQFIPKDVERVYVVESEKTAELLAASFPDLHFVATGAKDNLKDELLADLAGAHIVLIPDLDVITAHDEGRSNGTNWVKFANDRDGLHSERFGAKYSISVLTEWRHRTPHPVEGSDDIGDALQMFHPHDMKGRRALLGIENFPPLTTE
jgi:hypothetical protein